MKLRLCAPLSGIRTLPLPVLLLLPVELVCGGEGRCATLPLRPGRSSLLDTGLGGEGSSGGPLPLLPMKIAEDGRRRALSTGLLMGGPRASELPPLWVGPRRRL